MIYPSRKLTLFLIITLLTQVFGVAAQLVEFRMDSDEKRVVSYSQTLAEDQVFHDAVEPFIGILNRMSDQSVVKSEKIVEKGIILAVAQDWVEYAKEVGLDSESVLGREDYFIQSEQDRLVVVGATVLGVKHGLADILYRLGYRRYFPQKEWEIVPEPKVLEIAVSEVQRPDFVVRRVFNNLLSQKGREEYQEWEMWNRMGRGFTLNTQHNYMQIYAANRELFAQHPEYYAEHNGKREFRRREVKFDASEPGVHRMVSEFARDWFESNPDQDSISMEPSDFAGWDNTGKASREIGGPSDQAVAIANTVARDVAAPLGKYVGMYAYYWHQQPPENRDLEPNVIVSVATRFLRPRVELFDLISRWKERGLEMLGIRDYASVWM